MPKHFAQQLVEAVQAKLAGLATTGSNVFSQDDYPREDASLPCVNIYADRFEREPRGVNASQRPSATNMVIPVVEGVVAGGNSGRETAWQIAKEVEERWLGTTNDERLVGLITPPVQRVTLNACEVRVSTEGSKAFAIAEMQFQAKVLSIEGRPDLT